MLELKDGEASRSVAGPFELSQVSVKNMQSILLSKVRSLIINVLFKSDLTFKSTLCYNFLV